MLNSLSQTSGALLHILSDAEIELALAIEAGESKRFTGEADGIPTTVIHAEMLRHVMLGLDVWIHDEVRVITVRGNGIKVHNVYVSGRLDLDNGCLPNGEALPRLSLEECYIPERMSLLSCRLRRLCLKNSRLNFLRANDALIGSQLDIEGVRSCGEIIGAQKQPVCRISLRGAHVEDGIEARKAVLTSNPARSGYVPFNSRSRYALDLAGLTSGGDIRLFPDFKAFGGVNLSGAHIRGSVQAHGALVTKEEVFAFDLDGAVIEGKLALCARQNLQKCVIPFEAHGGIDLSNTKIGNALIMSGAKINGDLIVDYARVDGKVMFDCTDGFQDDRPVLVNFFCSETLSLNGVRIGGGINFSGASLKKKLSVSTATIGGDFIASRHTHAQSKTSSQGFRIEDDFNIDGSQIQGDFNLDYAQFEKNIQAKGLKVRGFCQMRSNPDSDSEYFECKGEFDFSHSEIGLDYDMSGARLYKGVDGRNIVVGGNLRLRMAHIQDVKSHEKPFTDLERVNISGAQIKGDLDLYYAELHKGIRARGVKINSALVVRLLNLPHNNTYGAYNVDLTNASANVVVDGPGNGDHYGPFLLSLEGFEYGRFIVSQDEKSSTNPYSKAPLRANVPNTWKGRDRWLRKQFSNFNNRETLRIEYKADTYATLYNVLKNNGLLRESNHILTEKLRIEGRLMSWPLSVINFIFEWVCGFGLNPLRALVSFSLYAILISQFIAQADGHLGGLKLDRTHIPEINSVEASVENILNPLGMAVSKSMNFIGFKPGVLVVQGAPVTQLESKSPKDSEIANDFYEVKSKHETGRTAQVRCGSRINEMLYTMDMIIPAVEFNQTKKCDFADDSGMNWVIFKIFATLIGWFMTSITALTLSGIVRRQIEPH